MKNPIILFLCTICAIATNAQVGIGTTSPNTTLDVRGSIAINSRSFSTTSESVAATDYTLLFTGTSACTLTLPDATLFPGRLIHIKNTKTGTVPILTISTTSSQTIDGALTYLLDDPNEAVNVISDGANWRIMGQSLPSGSGTSWTQGGNTVTSIKKLGTIDNYDLPFITNNTERMRLNTSGFLGLGTTNPLGRIHAVSESSESGDDYIFDDYGTTTQGIFIRKARGTVASPSNLQSGDLISYLRFSGRYNGTLGYAVGSGIDAYYMGNGTLDSTDLRFFTSGGERMRINHRGNVGIGTSSFSSINPEKLLVDAGTSTNTVIYSKGNVDDYLQFNIQNLNNGNSASSDIVATANNGTSGTVYVDLGINSQGYANSSTNILNGSNTAYLYSSAAAFYIGNGATDEDLIFFTNDGAMSTVSANGTKRMTIKGSGEVIVGSGNTVGSNLLTVGGSISASAFNVNSDRRLKTNIRRTNYGLKEIMNLQPVSWNWKDKNLDAASQLGLIAQDARKIVPEIVSGNEQTTTLSINYTELIPVLINAVKEQQQQIEELKKKVKRLEHK
jgi:hypothetical protein